MIFAAICISQEIQGDDKTKSPFARHSIEISGNVAMGKDGSIYVSDRGRRDDYSILQTMKRWYLDISPVISYYFVDNWFIYGSPAFSMNSIYYEFAPLYTGEPDILTRPTSISEARLDIDYVPYAGLGHVFQLSEKLFLSAATDVQLTWYQIARDARIFNRSLTRFNLRLTPKILLVDTIFLNIAAILSYETDRIILPWFKKSGYDQKIDAVSMNLQVGISWSF